jgi:hypothetical protein
MARGITVLFLWGLVACSSVDMVPTYSELEYDFQIKSSYPITNNHRNIHLYLDASGLVPPKGMETIEGLKLNWTDAEAQSQIAIYIRFSDSFLIERQAGQRRELTYNHNGRGELQYVPIQRGFVRTHYNIEVVDKITDSLINDFQGADNFSIEAMQADTLKARRALLKSEFHKKKLVARKALLEKLLDQLDSHYLVDVMVTFGQKEFSLVSELKEEAAFASAFSQLKKNKKNAALKALSIYNDALKKYPSGESEKIDQIRQWLDEGITAASAIANHQYEDRYNR